MATSDALLDYPGLVAELNPNNEYPPDHYLPSPRQKVFVVPAQGPGRTAMTAYHNSHSIRVRPVINT